MDFDFLLTGRGGRSVGRLTNQRLHSTAINIYFSTLAPLGVSKLKSSHAEDIEHSFTPTSLAFGLNVTTSVLKNNNRIVFAIGAFNHSWLLTGNGIAGHSYLHQHFCRWLCNADVFAHAHTSVGSSYSLYGRSSMYPSCRRRMIMAVLDTSSHWQR